MYSERPPRAAYVLTEVGRDYLPVLFTIGVWESTIARIAILATHFAAIGSRSSLPVLRLKPCRDGQAYVAIP
ncbi:hypothetical protein [Lysobacter capsici]|uniref:hypothetical protein n=1 Tax=Lysobacter capsici TaxID=435897 RepID=UPI0017851666